MAVPAQELSSPPLVDQNHSSHKVFVTGGTGFIGAYIIQNLVEKGIPVRALRRSDHLPFYIPVSIWNKVEWVDGDVMDIVSLSEGMEGVHSVIHAAAIVSFHRHERSQMYKVNVEGTQNVVNAALEQGVQRFIHVSSVAAIGRSDKNEKVSEDKTWTDSKNNTHYAITKHGAELEVWRGFAEGLEGVIVNPSTVLGFGDWRRSSCAIFRNVYREFPWYSEGVNGFTGVEDLSEAVVQLMQSSFVEKRFIINTDNWSFQQLFDTIALAFGKRKPGKKATPFIGEIAWRLEKARTVFSDGRPLLTRESARVAHSKTTFDNEALLKALPLFSFKPLQEVIHEACIKYRIASQNGWIN